MPRRKRSRLIIAHIQLSDENDMSIYSFLINNANVFYNKSLWKLKVPLHIKIFMWYLLGDVILTKDNLSRRNWQENKKCVFCDLYKSIPHLFFMCHYTRFYWRLAHCCFGLNIPRYVKHAFWIMAVGGLFSFKCPQNIKIIIVLWCISKYYRYFYQKHLMDEGTRFRILSQRDKWRSRSKSSQVR